MSARAERVVPAKRIRTEQVVVNFDAERLKAPFSLRCGAILIDYILLVSVPVSSLIIARLMGIEPAKLLNSEISNAGWLITILLILTNFVILPLFSGQSIGKMLTGLRIVKIDGNAPSFTALLVRHLIGYPLSFLIFGLGFLLPVLNQKGRALHDVLAGTVVVYGRRRAK
ncbi:MAG: RDD family protein [Pyrinomonadaceae bacterium]